MPETSFYIVAAYDDLRDVLSDPDTFSSRAGFAKGLQADRVNQHQRILGERGWAHVATLQRTDPPEHTRYRQLLNRVFTARRVRELAPHIDEVTNRLIDAFAPAGRCEFVSEFALPLPGIIIAEQLGLEPEQIDTFKRWADAMLATSMQLLSEEQTAEVAAVELEAQHHLATVFEDRRVHPRNDLMSALVHAHVDGEEPLTMHELQNLMHQLVTGGFETTTSALGHGMWLLLRHPDQLARLRSDHGLMKGFVEEALRIESPVQGLARRTTRDVEVQGVTIPAGSMVLVRYGAANRDEAHFPEADRFDIGRANSASHLAFGLGPHYCIGAALARQEMTSAFTHLLARLDDLALDEPVPDPAHHPSTFLLPLKELRMRFTVKADG
jgi:cytochrome P450